MYKKNENIVLRKIEPSYLLVDITKCYNNTTEKMFITDEIGAEMYKCINDSDSFEDVLSKFLDKLNDKDASLIQQVRNDLEEFIDLLISQNCIYEV